jgi:hypothetical protein
MNCVEIQTSLAENLSARSEPLIAEHLAGCVDCSKACEELLELEALSQSLSGRFKVPSNFRDTVLCRFEEERPLRRWRTLLGVSCVVLLAAVVVFFKPWAVSGSEGNPAAGSSFSYPTSSMSVPSADADFVEIVVPGEGGNEIIVRLPSVIEVHRTQLQEDFYITNVSH